jgi:anti-sigma B factor antagonist
VINLYINQHRVEDVVVLDLKGRIRILGNSLQLHKAIRCLIDEGKTQILLNLAWVTYIDSDGLGELTSSQVALNNKGGALKLMHLTESVRELLTATNLLTFFDIYDDEPEALASFESKRLKVVEAQPSFV